MPRLNLEPSQKTVAEGERFLANNEYPGRVIIMGLNSPGDLAIQAYALTGRSEGSRNRVLVPEPAGDNPDYTVGVRTVAPDMTPEEMAQVENAGLIYYRAMDEMDGDYVVSNGAQTEPVLHSLLRQQNIRFDNFDLEFAVRAAPTVNGVDLSKYEPDTPNYTPRITGALYEADGKTPFGLSIISKSRDTRAKYATYKGKNLRALTPGVGYGIQTYAGNGAPLPSFDREPYAFPLGETTEEVAHSIWNVLNQDNRVAVVVRSVDIYSGTEYHIINARGPEQHIGIY